MRFLLFKSTEIHEQPKIHRTWCDVITQSLEVMVRIWRHFTEPFMEVVWKWVFLPGRTYILRRNIVGLWRDHEALTSVGLKFLLCSLKSIPWHMPGPGLSRLAPAIFWAFTTFLRLNAGNSRSELWPVKIMAGKRMKVPTYSVWSMTNSCAPN